MVLPEALRKRLEAARAGCASMQRLQSLVYEHSTRTLPPVPTTPQRSASENVVILAASPVQDQPNFDLSISTSGGQRESPNIGECTVEVARPEPVNSGENTEAVARREIPEDTRAVDLEMEDAPSAGGEERLPPASQQMVLAEHPSPSQLRSRPIVASPKKKGGGKPFLFKPVRRSASEIGRIPTFHAGSTSRAPGDDSENQEQTRMVHRRRLGRHRRLPHLRAFSSFSRVLALSRLKSNVRSWFAETSLASKAAAQSESLDHIRTTKIKRPKYSLSLDDDDGEEQPQEKEAIVQADFGFFDPKPRDFHGVKLLLQNYLDENPWDLSGFVDLILGQITVGTVVKLDGDDEQGDEEDLYAVVSALNIGRYSGHRCIMELKEFLIGVCRDESMKKKLKLLLEQQANDVGLLISQRFVNCPHQLVPPLYDALFDEVSWATEDEPTQELKDSFCFKLYLLITKIYQNKHANQCTAKGKHDPDESIIYLKAEDEIFHEMSSLSFTFRLHSSPCVPSELKNYRAMGLVMVINADAIPKFREQLKSLLAES